MLPRGPHDGKYPARGNATGSIFLQCSSHHYFSYNNASISHCFVAEKQSHRWTLPAGASICLFLHFLLFTFTRQFDLFVYFLLFIFTYFFEQHLSKSANSSIATPKKRRKVAYQTKLTPNGPLPGAKAATRKHTTHVQRPLIVDDDQPNEPVLSNEPALCPGA